MLCKFQREGQNLSKLKKVTYDEGVQPITTPCSSFYRVTGKVIFHHHHLSLVGLGRWFATHHTQTPNLDESSSYPPKRGNSWEM